MEIYLDNSATTKLDKEVLEEMLPYLTGEFANPSSIYTIARTTKQAIEKSRDLIADKLGAKSKEIFFTSGGSESDNWAIKGTVDANIGKHIITTPIEHHAVLNTFEYLEKKGYDVSYLKVDSDGIVDLEYLENILNENTALVSVMYANNEIGTIEPIEKIGNILKERNILFHVDGVQALSGIDFKLKDLPVDLMSFSAHKIRGPKGIGALYIKEGTKINPIIHGGSQERGRRAGTENVASIVGFAKAVDISRKNIKNDVKYIENLRNILMNSLLEIDGVYLNGSSKNRLSNNINISIEKVDVQALLMMLDMRGVYASSGSACTAGSMAPSHVLKSIGRSDELARNCLRLSLGIDNNIYEINEASVIIREVIETLRR
ncbi:cysteine desulfurase family protein [Peptoniphilus sp. oral taxon 386]|uniref:cysteine desulfurase family protein n=1 Tax=Peptoniphilus sp. oral taxon 386 TaxID=652713 RepID=UPI0001DA9C9D|nr:cysteine desulfurase family protein [Peptoniphilus sp. oral taxon 386]EFI42445.1 putative cysteine desulfurase NifS [Peptoniphilus sp. oral taxon 386 str. F0131]